MHIPSSGSVPGIYAKKGSKGRRLYVVEIISYVIRLPLLF
jgi:hypothetical protein